MTMIGGRAEYCAAGHDVLCPGKGATGASTGGSSLERPVAFDVREPDERPGGAGIASGSAADHCSGDGVYLCADRDYGGSCVKVTETTPNLGALGFDNGVSSLRFVGGFSGGHRVAELYTEVNYGGSIQVVHEDDPWLGSNYATVLPGLEAVDLRLQHLGNEYRWVRVH
jgi:hypothetical protein